MRALCFALVSVALAAPALGGDLTVEVRDQAGQPVRDAVVMVKPAAGAAAGAKLTGALSMAQQNIQFAPHVLIVPLGATVAFPNKDKVRHHVYSFSATKKFELKLYGRDETRTVTFDKAGPVSLGCNIHDTMAGYIYVSDTPYAAKTGETGVAMVKDVPAGGATLIVWSPDLRARTPATRTFAVTAADQRTSAALDLRPAIAR